MLTQYLFFNLFVFFSFKAKFIVHVRRPGVVALQSFADTRRWISITGKGHLDGKVTSKYNNGYPLLLLLIGVGRGAAPMD